VRRGADAVRYGLQGLIIIIISQSKELGWQLHLHHTSGGILQHSMVSKVETLVHSVGDQA
jgi:hypothetical protein